MKEHVYSFREASCSTTGKQSAHSLACLHQRLGFYLALSIFQVSSSKSRGPPTPAFTHKKQYATLPNGSHDRKQNVAIRGILECPKNTRRHNRILQDDQLAAKVVSSIIPTFSSFGIKECTCTCLGRYVASNPWPRSLLIQLVRACDVSQTLANHGTLFSSSYYVP